MGEHQPGSPHAPAATTGPAGWDGPALAGPAGRDAAWHARARTARLLAWVSLAWMAGEGALGLVAGARSGSISLTGWAAGSAIEALASLIVIWRFTGSRTLSPTAEDRARKAVAVSFFLLAPYLAAQSVQYLLTGHRPTASMLGIAVTTASMLVMPVLGIAKQRLGARLDSRATAGEGTQNLLCAAQAAAVLAGLAATATLGWWQADPVIALALAALAVREGPGSLARRRLLLTARRSTLGRRVRCRPPARPLCDGQAYRTRRPLTGPRPASTPRSSSFRWLALRPGVGPALLLARGCAQPIMPICPSWCHCCSWASSDCRSASMVRASARACGLAPEPSSCRHSAISAL